MKELTEAQKKVFEEKKRIDKEAEDRKREIETMASELLKLARDTITVRFRFFDNALARLKVKYRYGLFGVMTDGNNIYIDPTYILKMYLEEKNIAVRMYMHVLLHVIFMHQFQYDKLNEKFWNLATDIAVENIILEMDFLSASLKRDGEELDKLMILKKRVPKLTADKIYKEFLVHSLSHDTEQEYKRLFTVDFHDSWRKTEMSTEELIVTKEDLEKIAKRIQTDIKTFSKNKSGSESLENNIDEAVRERYNYREILENFTVMGEEITVNDDEFDYIYYTYGLSTYGNMPLVEPLEYKENKKVKEFVIAIDTSASCRGSIVRQFLQTTYEILKQSENFFKKVNIHIIQCDSEIQSDTKIENDEDFEAFIKNGKIRGFGQTNFIPVFDYVDKMKSDGEFDNLQGLIYFTDGYGEYPSRCPDYDVIFAFLNEDENRPKVPGWAINVVLEEDTFE